MRQTSHIAFPTCGSGRLNAVGLNVNGRPRGCRGIEPTAARPHHSPCGAHESCPAVAPSALRRPVLAAPSHFSVNHRHNALEIIPRRAAPWIQQLACSSGQKQPGKAWSGLYTEVERSRVTEAEVSENGNGTVWQNSVFPAQTLTNKSLNKHPPAALS